MAQIPTTAGPVEAADLGRTMGHEHLRSMQEAPRAQFPHLYDDEAALERHVHDVRQLIPFGVETVCDPSPLDLGRDVDVNIEVTNRTGVRFVMATGIYQRFGEIVDYFRLRDVDVLVDAFVHDLREGIQGTDVRAGFIKTAVDEPGMTPDVEKVHRAAARASLETGAPIMVHSNARLRTGLEALRILSEESVPLDRVQIAHVGDAEEPGYAHAVLAAGAYIGLDRYGADNWLSTPKRNAVLLELCEQGHSSKVILGHDYASRIDLFDREVQERDYPNWYWTHVFKHVLPELRRAGLTDATLDPMVGDNVQRWLSAEA